MTALALVSGSTVAEAQSLQVGGKAEASTEAVDAEADAEAESSEDSDEEEAGASVAAEPEPEPEPEPVEESAPESVAEAEQEEPKATDHETVVGGLGVGLLGNIVVRNTNVNFAALNANVPVIGARYWFTERFGLQAGLGLTVTSGVRKDNSAAENTFDLTQWNTGFHVGAPISIFDGAHYNFLVIPELNLGYSTGRTKDDPNFPTDQGFKQAAWAFGAAVKAGAEVQFGFIGIPQLSLQGSIGLGLDYRTAMIETVENGQTVRRNHQWFSAGTGSYNDPWDLFLGSIAALYYFDM